MLLKNINNEVSGLVISDGFNLTIVEYTPEKAIFFVVVPLVFHIQGLLVQLFFIIFCFCSISLPY